MRPAATFLSLLVVVLLVPFTGGCAKAKAYSGATRPDRELSTIYFHASPEVTLSAMTFDSQRKSLSANGYSALPGRHSYRVNYHLPRGAGTCTGDFSSEAGKEYIIDVTGARDAASVSVYTDQRRVLVTSGDCR